MKIRRLFVLGIALLVLVASLACTFVGGRMVRGSGSMAEHVYDVSDFDQVSLSNFGNLHIQIGEQESLHVEAEDNLIEYFDVRVEGSTLRIGTQPHVSLIPTQSVDFYLTAKELNGIAVSGSGDVDAAPLVAERFQVSASGTGGVHLDRLEAETLTVKISGSGGLDIADGVIGDQQIEISGTGRYDAAATTATNARQIEIDVSGSGSVALGEIEADEIQVKISGVGSVSVASGTVERQRIDITGSGDYRARELESAEARMHTSGTGTAELWVEDVLDVDISGSGSVHYAGQPAVTSSISGVGQIEQIDE